MLKLNRASDGPNGSTKHPSIVVVKVEEAQLEGYGYGLYQTFSLDVLSLYHDNLRILHYALSAENLSEFSLRVG